MLESVYLTKNTIFLGVTLYGKDGGNVILREVGRPTRPQDYAASLAYILHSQRRDNSRFHIVVHV
jgi:hypothetical protein